MTESGSAAGASGKETDIYHILYSCIPLLCPRAATSSAKNCPSDLTSKGYLRLLGSASTRSGFTGLFLTYPASALSPRPTCLADPMLLQFFSHLRRSYPAERHPYLPTGRRTPPRSWRRCLVPPTLLLGAIDAAAWRHQRRRIVAPPSPSWLRDVPHLSQQRRSTPSFFPALSARRQHGSLGAAKP